MPPTDQYNPASPGLSAPGRKSSVVSPSDTVDFTTLPRAIFVGTGGNVALTLADDTTGASVVFKNVASGSILSVRASRLWATGTTAADMVALY